MIVLKRMSSAWLQWQRWQGAAPTLMCRFFPPAGGRATAEGVVKMSTGHQDDVSRLPSSPSLPRPLPLLPHLSLPTAHPLPRAPPAPSPPLTPFLPAIIIGLSRQIGYRVGIRRQIKFFTHTKTQQLSPI